MASPCQHFSLRTAADTAMDRRPWHPPAGGLALPHRAGFEPGPLRCRHCRAVVGEPQNGHSVAPRPTRCGLRRRPWRVNSGFSITWSLGLSPRLTLMDQAECVRERRMPQLIFSWHTTARARSLHHFRTIRAVTSVDLQWRLSILSSPAGSIREFRHVGVIQEGVRPWAEVDTCPGEIAPPSCCTARMRREGSRRRV